MLTSTHIAETAYGLSTLVSAMYSLSGSKELTNTARPLGESGQDTFAETAYGFSTLVSAMHSLSGSKEPMNNAHPLGESGQDTFPQENTVRRMGMEAHGLPATAGTPPMVTDIAPTSQAKEPLAVAAALL